MDLLTSNLNIFLIHCLNSFLFKFYVPLHKYIILTSVLWSRNDGSGAEIVALKPELWRWNRNCTERTVDSLLSDTILTNKQMRIKLNIYCKKPEWFEIYRCGNPVDSRWYRCWNPVDSRWYQCGNLVDSSRFENLELKNYHIYINKINFKRVE